ncbi:hypothetical protein J8273_8608 [Carpediemonas membranifera]|uniref:Secreted protein n=1 Tax=Carpediemonas membranifera TaxID=201153 RepID=A0A8J6DZ40_9EUKA|nr:hypothetical protein J8273_8608 [Carpediemonas membranifera]|eukprot:KAG9389921.1 hypothetical protein J8273_8608 [Carpediemonas membranifera]
MIVLSFLRKLLPSLILNHPFALVMTISNQHQPPDNQSLDTKLVIKKHRSESSSNHLVLCHVGRSSRRSNKASSSRKKTRW